MTIKVIFSLLFFNFLFISCGSDPGPVVAEVGDQKVYAREFLERYTNYLFDANVKDNYLTRQAILNNIVNETLLKFYDDNSSINNDPQYKIDQDWAYKQAVLAYLKDQEVYAKITVTDKELREAFLRSNEKIAARHLFATTEDEADNLYQLLQIGRSFNDLAKEVFTDSVLANNGGYLGYFSWGDMDPAFEDAAFSLNKGETSKPVKTQNGFSIIKLEDRVEKPIITENEFINNRNHLVSVIRLRKRSSSEKEYLNKVFDLKAVKFYDDNLLKLYEFLQQKISGPRHNELPDFQNEICAEYKGHKITNDEAVKYFNTLPSYHLSKINSIENLKAAVKGFLIQDELYKIAVDKGYDDNKTVLKTFDKMKLNLFIKYKRAEIVNKAQFSDSLLTDYYQNNIDQFTKPKMLSIQEIIVKSKTEAEKIKKEIKQGSDFGVLAKQYSLRPASRTNSGIISLSPLSYFGKFQDVFWNAGLNKVIGPFEFDGYYGIFKILEKKDAAPLDFSKAYESVVKNVKVVNGKRIFEEYIDNLSKNVPININRDYLKSFTINTDLKNKAAIN